MGISATYLGSAQLDPNAETRALSTGSSTLLLLVSPSGYLAQMTKT